MSLGPCRTALLASLAKGFGIFANLNSSLSSVSHMQDKERAVFSFQSSSSALHWDPGAPSSQNHSGGSAWSSAGLAHKGSCSRGTNLKGG